MIKPFYKSFPPSDPVNPDQLGEVLSSKVRLKIAGALSVRPRTLNELADLTGISVQGVLRHLRRLQELGLVEEKKLAAKAPRARRVYASKVTALGDYSSGSLTIVKATDKWDGRARGTRSTPDLEQMAVELLIQRRRIRDEAKHLGRMIDELADDQEALMSYLDRMKLSSEERLVLEVIFTEETLEEGERALARYYGLGDRRSIDKALAKAKRSVDK